jgi:hypothetical protein
VPSVSAALSVCARGSSAGRYGAAAKSRENAIAAVRCGASARKISQLEAPANSQASRCPDNPGPSRET